MSIFKMNDGYWEIPDGEKEARKNVSYSVCKDFPFPKKVADDLAIVDSALSRPADYEKMPGYILNAFGLYRENYPDSEKWDEAIEDFICEKIGDTGFNWMDTGCHYNKKTGMTEVFGEHFNLPFFSRILSTILAHHGVNEVYTIEAARLCREREYIDNDVFGGEVWAIGPGCVSFLSTDDVRPQLVETLRHELDSGPFAHMAP